VPASSKDAELTKHEALPLNRYFIFAAISVTGCLVDLSTKHWIFEWRGLPRDHGEWWLWEPYVGIETAVNTGALFGFGPGYGLFFAVLSIAAGVGIIYWLFFSGAALDFWLTIALSCVMAGILGNLYDRLGLWTEPSMPPEWDSGVRDWILLRYGRYTWPNFNIADALLVCGAGMLMIHAIRDQPKSVPISE
jgi:signal peptidase II